MITLQDLGLAYRKAKVDFYYSSQASLDAIASYEENLHSNLSALLQKINDGNEAWVTEPEFIGTWMPVAKTVKWTAGRSTKEQWRWTYFFLA
ncbi:hypothetical protein HED50_22705 [Ochrobactrum oryzae]|nr:hypothetical protein [Brucella oryzae]